jgi:hypothetical protein
MKYRGNRKTRKSMKALQSVIPSVCETIMMLFHSATNTHIQHLQTKSFSAHMTLGAYYPKIVELTDSIVETMQGLNNEILTGYPLDNSGFSESMTPLEYMRDVRNKFQSGRQSFPQDSHIQSLLDMVSELIDSTIYKLQFLN